MRKKLYMTVVTAYIGVARPIFDLNLFHRPKMTTGLSKKFQKLSYNLLYKHLKYRAILPTSNRINISKPK